MAPRNIPTVLEFRGKSFIIWEDVDNKFLRACLAEFMAMNLFVLLCCGCAMVTLNLPNPNLMMVAASFGFGILVLAQIFGPLSGGHINCAVSFGLFVAGRTSLIKTFCFTLSQMLGSIFGALFLWAIFGSHWPAARAFGSNSWDEAVFTSGQVFFAEMLGTMILMFNVLSTIDIPTGDGGPLAVFPIAMSVMIAHLFLLPIDGCSINPSRSFGPSVVANWAKIEGNFSHQQYIFWLGPMFGAGLAAAIYEYASLKPENFAGARDMDTAIFQAGKKRKIKTKALHSTPQSAPRSGLEVASNEPQGGYNDVRMGMGMDGSGGGGGYQDPFASNEEAPFHETEDVSNIYRSAVNSPMVTNPMLRKAATAGAGGGGGGARAPVDPSISIGVGSDEFEEEDLKSSAQQHSR